MKATRDGFGEGLVNCGKKDNVIVLSADLSKSTKADCFQRKYPDRFFECGIAEANMIGIAGGLAANGFRVFISSFASFITGRYDIIRCSLAYSKAPVVIVGTHGGLAIGRDGVTQMGLEDISVMNSLPGMTIFNPSTATEAKLITEFLSSAKLSGPVYLRLGRQPVSDCHIDKLVDYEKFSFGDNNDVLVITSGCTKDLATQTSQALKCKMINLIKLKPLPDISELLKSGSTIITIEDHSVIGGLGSIICNYIADNGLGIKVIKIGIQDIFPESGDPFDLYNKYGLSVENILNEYKQRN